MSECQLLCRMTRAAQHACDLDARNKQHCQSIDERMHQLHNESPGLGHYPGIETYDNTSVDFISLASVLLLVCITKKNRIEYTVFQFDLL